MRYLVTGGAGFIGSHIVRRLVGDGHQVTVLDDFSSGRGENLADVEREIQIIEGDIRDMGVVEHAVSGVQVVFHHAAVASVPKSIADPRTTIEVGVNGTLNVLLAAAAAGVRRLVFASSSSVYGDTDESPKREDLTPQPRSPYAISKLTGEQLCDVFWRTRGLETVVLRYFNVYGPGQDPDSEYAAVIPRLTHTLVSGIRPTIYGDGEQTRDFIHVHDVVEANLLAAHSAGAVGGVFNIGSQQAVSVNWVLAILTSMVGGQLHATYAPARPGDISHSLADITAARRALGFRPSISLEEGLRELVEARVVAASGEPPETLVSARS